MKSVKVLMVCLGNICRSPLAEGILVSKIGRLNIQVDSAGTAAFHTGNLPDVRSIKVAKQNGIDITNQQARQIVAQDLDTFDYIYAMDEVNYRNILALTTTNQQRQKVKMIMNELLPNENISVPDPYYGGQDGFTNVFKMLNEACNEIIKKISAQ